jgi:hypothetical protein
MQTLIGQLSQVSRNQAVEKEGAALQAAIQGAAEEKRKEDAKEAIRRTEAEETATAPIKDRQGGGGAEGEVPQGAESEAREEEPETGDIVRDPSLGKHIDLTG